MASGQLNRWPGARVQGHLPGQALLEPFEFFYGYMHYDLMDTYIKLLCCTPKTSTMLDVNYISKKLPPKCCKELCHQHVKTHKLQV